MSGHEPLRDVRLVSMALNVPGPVAVARLAAAGAAVTKVEPPAGDPLATLAPAWFAALHAGVRRETIDVKASGGLATLLALVRSADVFVTSQRPAALDRLGLTAERMTADAPAVRWVRIVGDAAAPDRPGHDVTYQAEAGLLDDRLPRSLLADLFGAEQVISAVLLALRDTPGRRIDVGLRDALETLRAPLVHGLTRPWGLLGGGDPAYGVYQARDGHVAVAALEPHFRTRLYAALALPVDAPLADAFATRTTAEWTAFAAEHDLPIGVVRRD